MRAVLLAVAVVLFSSLVPSADAQAKGGRGFITFRLSAGDLPHPVTISLVEAVLTNSQLTGSWYVQTGLAEPEPSRTRYRVEELQIGSSSPLQTWLYVPGPVPRMLALQGEGAEAGWAEPIEVLADLIDRYIVLGLQGDLPAEPLFAEVLRASQALVGVEVSIDGTSRDGDADEILTALGSIRPVYFGVRGRLIGQRDLRQVDITIGIGSGRISLEYVPPGSVAPYGLLFSPQALGSWDYIELLDPPGYAQVAFDIPEDFELLMADLGFEGRQLEDVIDLHKVPLLEAVRDYGLDRVEVWKDGALRAVLRDIEDVGCPNPTGPDCVSASPVEPFAGQSLIVEVWPRGIEPFPEAVRPDRYLYYPADSSSLRRGVLVQTEAGAVYNGGGGQLQPPFYPAVELDRLLQDAAQASTSSGSGVGVWRVVLAAAVALALMMITATAVLVRLRRQQDA